MLAQQPSPLAFGTTSNGNPYLDLDPTQTFQTVDAFGFALTGGGASVIASLAPAAEAALLQELYGNGPTDIGISFIRLSIGASDMSASTFTYDDVAQGQTDPNLASFSIAPEETALIPVLKAVLAIQPSIEILASGVRWPHTSGSPDHWMGATWQVMSMQSVAPALQQSPVAVHASPTPAIMKLSVAEL